ncbi:MAG: thiol-disulfide isomerase/thioredoxin [Flavobacterium sp.]|jgi:thiol-disulfide isomerase/thioredoxin
MKKILLLTLSLLTTCITLGQGKIQFKANITNPNSDKLSFRDMKDGKTVAVLNASKSGIFNGEIVAADGFYQLNDGMEAAVLYFKDGYNLAMKMDAKLFDETISFSGKGSKENNFLVAGTIEGEKFEEANFDKSKEDFYAAFEVRKKKDMDALATGGFDESFLTYAKKDVMNNLIQLQTSYKNAQLQKAITGKQSAGFDYENHKGGKTKLEDFKGKYVYLDIWATWCGPCRAEIPSLKKIEEKYHGKNIEFVSISVDVDKDHEKWQKFVSDKELGGVQLFADKNWMSDFIQSYGINAIPRFILLDPNGNVVSADANRPSDSKLQEQLDKLLK